MIYLLYFVVLSSVSVSCLIICLLSLLLSVQNSLLLSCLLRNSIFHKPQESLAEIFNYCTIVNTNTNSQNSALTEYLLKCENV